MTTLVNRLRRRQKGFTLIELLVVVAIIGLLAAFAVPKLFDAINKSKKAPGQADMQTISAALDRFYMENPTGMTAYPTGNSQAVRDALAGGFLKAGTTYLNGFKQPYLYGTSPTGSGYVLIDLQGTAVAAGTNVVVTCTAAGAGATPNTYNFPMPAAGAAPQLVVNSTMAEADLTGTCSVTTPAAGTTMIRN